MKSTLNSFFGILKVSVMVVVAGVVSGCMVIPPPPEVDQPRYRTRQIYIYKEAAYYPYVRGSFEFRARQVRKTPGYWFQGRWFPETRIYEQPIVVEEPCEVIVVPRPTPRPVPCSCGRYH